MKYISSEILTVICILLWIWKCEANPIVHPVHPVSPEAVRTLQATAYGRQKRLHGLHVDNNPFTAATRCGLVNGVIGTLTGGGLGMPGLPGLSFISYIPGLGRRKRTYAVDDCGLVSGVVGTGTGLTGALVGKRESAYDINSDRR